METQKYKITGGGAFSESSKEENPTCIRCHKTFHMGIRIGRDKYAQWICFADGTTEERISAGYGGYELWKQN